MASLLEKLRWTAMLGVHALSESRRDRVRDSNLLLARQRRHVRRAVEHAFRQVPFYRDAMTARGLSPHDFRDANDLARLPLLGRRELQESPERLRPGRIFRPLPISSSGTTGVPVTIVFDLPSMLRDAAYGIRERAVLWPLLGRRVPRRELLVVAEPSSGEEMREHCRRHLFEPPGVRPERRIVFFDTPPEQAARLLDEIRPEVVITYGSYLGPWFRAAAKRPVGAHWPRAAIYYGDAVSPSTRANLTGLGIACLSRYKAMEAPNLGFECEQHTGIHINVDLYPFRIVDDDGRDLPDGSEGSLVISNLVNRGTVLLNYRLSDVVARIAEACPCGRVLPLVSYPAGRRDHSLINQSGREVHYQVVHKWFLDEPLDAYQVIQESTSELRYLVVTSPGVALDPVMARILARTHQDFGPVNIAVEVVPSIPRSPRGKHRPVISKVPRPH